MAITTFQWEDHGGPKKTESPPRLGGWLAPPRIQEDCSGGGKSWEALPAPRLGWRQWGLSSLVPGKWSVVNPQEMEGAICQVRLPRFYWVSEMHVISDTSQGGLRKGQLQVDSSAYQGWGVQEATWNGNGRNMGGSSTNLYCHSSKHFPIYL